MLADVQILWLGENVSMCVITLKVIPSLFNSGDRMHKLLQSEKAHFVCPVSHIAAVAPCQMRCHASSRTATLELLPEMFQCRMSFEKGTCSVTFACIFLPFAFTLYWRFFLINRTCITVVVVQFYT